MTGKVGEGRASLITTAFLVTATLARVAAALARVTASTVLVPATAVPMAGRAAHTFGCISGSGGVAGSGPPAPHVEGPTGGRRTCHARLSATIRAASWGKRTASSAASPCS